ncbi:MAG: hypothetical protein V4510_06080 [bacterium]
MQERGAILWEYRPPRAHPILYAGLIVTLAVCAMGSLENALRDNRPLLYAVYAAPVAAVLLFMIALWRSPIRIHEQGLAPSRFLAARWHRPFVRWEEVAAAFPASYDVTGAFVSPFASSDGKVTQTGLGLELRDGSFETVRFTPTRFAENTRRSRGYREGMDVVRAIFAQQGRPLVATAEHLDAASRDRLLAEARRPFLPFFAIVFLFACAAPVLWLLAGAAHMPLATALPLALVLPLLTSLQSWLRSRRRNAILNRLAKVAEHERQGGAA